MKKNLKKDARKFTLNLHFWNHQGFSVRVVRFDFLVLRPFSTNRAIAIGHDFFSRKIRLVVRRRLFHTNFRELAVRGHLWVLSTPDFFFKLRVLISFPGYRQLGRSTTDRPKKSRNNTLHLRFRLNFAHRVIMAVDSHGENFSLVRRSDFEI